MEPQQHLFALMALAGDQQKAVRVAIEGLANERVSLALTIQAAIKDAVGTQVGAQARQALVAASGDLELATAQVIAGLGAAESRLLKATTEFRQGWRFASGLITLVLVVGLALVLLVGVAYANVLASQVSDLNDQRTALTAEIAQLAAERDWLKDRFAKAKTGRGMNVKQ